MMRGVSGGTKGQIEQNMAQQQQGHVHTPRDLPGRVRTSG